MGREILRVENVGKDYPALRKSGSRLRMVADLLRGRGISDHYRALDGISFSLSDGESMGIIGENGAGKSTLLKIIAGVIKPSRGRVQVHGRISALLELGSGFHPEYTGLENIDLAAALLGMSAAEIRGKRDEIVAFANIGEHISQPIKHYSSGMVVRLGFAVATALRPDILITDEVLAVGDESFQKKCIAWMEGFLRGGGSMLLCSHSMFQIQKLCRYALWIKDGVAQMAGASADVAQAYLAYHEERAAREKSVRDLASISSGALYAMRALTLKSGDGQACKEIAHGGQLLLEAEVYSPDGRPPVIAIGIVRADGTAVHGFTSDMDGFFPASGPAEHFRFAVNFPMLVLLPGRYRVRAHAMDPEGVRLFDTLEVPLTVTGKLRDVGVCRLDHCWSEYGAPQAIR